MKGVEGHSSPSPLYALLLSLMLVGCRAAPSVQLDGSSQDAPGDAASPVQIHLDRTFGLEGEMPTFIVSASPDRVLALTNRAVYHLDGDGRVIHRQGLPVASSGGVAQVLSAVWDGEGLGAALLFGHDVAISAGTYLAFSDGHGNMNADEMLPLGPAGGTALGDWDAAAGVHAVLWSEVQDGINLHLTRVQRSGTPVTSNLIQLPPGTTVGDFRDQDGSSALCTVDHESEVWLRTFVKKTAPGLIHLTDTSGPARGRCRLAWSGRSSLVVWMERGRVRSDAGVDLGPAALAHDIPFARVAAPDGSLSPPAQLSSYEGPVTIQSVVWDGRRYLVLLQTGHRGGRLILAAIDETGTLLSNLELPLPYEPGRLLGAKLDPTPTALLLLYAIRRPWDQGVLHLARLSLAP